MRERSTGIILAAILMMTVFYGCGAAKDSTASGQMGAAPAVTASSDNGGPTVQFSEAEGVTQHTADAKDVGGREKNAEEPSAEDQSKADSIAGSGNTIENVSNAILAERKIIRSANLTVEVENFDEACNSINSIILGIGIVQDSNITTDKIYVNDKIKLVKRGTIVLRVNKDKFDSVVNSLKGVGDVLNQQINGQDVTDKYVDTESRLRLLKLEQSRLEAYLLKFDDLDKIFRTESKLTEIRQEIESLTGNLKKMSSLVELSTITLTMNEKYPDSDKRQKPLTYGEKLLNHLKSSLEGVVTFLGELLIIIVALIPVLIVIGLFVLLGVFIYRRIPRKAKALTSASKNEEERKE